MRTADLTASRRIRVYVRSVALHGGSRQVSGVAVVVNGYGRVCQRWPLRVPVAPRQCSRDIYDRWNKAWENKPVPQPHCRNSVFGAQPPNRQLSSPSPGGARGLGKYKSQNANPSLNRNKFLLRNQ